MADTIRIPEVGLIAFAQRCVEDASGDLYMDLYTNEVAYSGAADHVVGSFTLMTTTDNTGYLQKTLTAATWGTATVVTLQGVSVYGSNIVWSFADATPSVDVWGYIVRDASGAGLGNVMWACYFESAKPIAYSTETITVTPTFKFGQPA